MKKIKQILVFSGIMLGFIGCAPVVNSDDAFIPYASTEDLEYYLQNEKNLVDYRISRKIALVELQENGEMFGLEKSDTISELPVLVFDSVSNSPKYYEFQVLRNGEVCGFITANANITNGEPIQFIGNERHEYNGVVSNRSGAAYRIYDGGYPNVYVGSSSNFSRMVD